MAGEAMHIFPCLLLMRDPIPDAVRMQTICAKRWIESTHSQCQRSMAGPFSSIFFFRSIRAEHM